MLIILDCAEFKISLFANLLTLCCHHNLILFIVFIIIIDDVTLSINYNYLSVKNVLSAANKLKMITEILCC